MRINAAVFWGIFVSMALVCQSQQVMLDLWGNNFTATDWSTSVGGHISPLTTCNGSQILGGYGLIGKKGFLSKTFTGLKNHSSVSISFDAYYIDSWDGLTKPDGIYLDVDGKNIFYRKYSMGTLSNIKICGAPNWPDHIQTESVGPFPHNSSSITLKFRSTLDQVATDESFGLKNLKIIVHLFCAQGCATCFGEEINECASCNKGWFLSETTCVQECPNSTFGNNQTLKCESCDSNCENCFGNATNCTSCKLGSFLQEMNSTKSKLNFCSNNCPEGYWGDHATHMCKKCYSDSSDSFSSCKSCDGSTRSDCTSCFSNTYLYPKSVGQCLRSCPDGFWEDLTKGVCEDTCPCELGYIRNSYNNRCGKCYPGCDFCTGPRLEDCYFSDFFNYTCKAGEFEGKGLVHAAGIMSTAFGYASIWLSLLGMLVSGAKTLGFVVAYSFFAMIHTYQYFNVSYPSNLVYYFQYFKDYTKYTYFPDVVAFLMEPDPKYLYSDSIIQGDNKFHLYRVSYIFLQNFGSRLSLLIFLVTLVYLLKLAARLMKITNVKAETREFVEKVIKFLRWNFILTLFLASYIPMMLGIFCQLQNMKMETMFDLLSVIALFGVLIFVGFFFYAYSKALISKAKPYSEIFENCEILRNMTGNAQVIGYKNAYWVLLFYVRNLLFVMCVSTLSKFPALQCSSALLVNLSYYIILLKGRFFDNKGKELTMLVIEITNAVLPLLFLMYAISDSFGIAFTEHGKTHVGGFIIFIMTIAIIGILVYQVVDNIAYKMYKNSHIANQDIQVSSENDAQSQHDNSIQLSSIDSENTPSGKKAGYFGLANENSRSPEPTNLDKEKGFLAGPPSTLSN